jgi:SagB-type dehydrogenase family enzyme
MSFPRKDPLEADQGALAEIFHENSKQARSDHRIAQRIIMMASNPVALMMADSPKRYRSAERITLPKELPEALLGFDQALATRRSERDFDGSPFSLGQVAKLLFFASGRTGSAPTHDGRLQYFRAAPSAGALYPVEVYLIALNAEGLAAGVYHYDSVANTLELVRRGNFSHDLAAATYTEEIEQASVVIAMTGILIKTHLKYGERGYRFMLMEAGHVGENILLTANSLGLGAVPIGGFVDDELDRLLNIDGLDEVSLYLVALGRLKRLNGTHEST